MEKTKLPFEISIHNIGINLSGEIYVSLLVKYHKIGFAKKLDSTEIYINVTKEIKRREA